MLKNCFRIPLNNHWSTKKNFFIGASNIRALLEYIWGADSENDGGFFASALVFEIRYTAHICLQLVLCFC